MSVVLQGCKGEVYYIDDILVAGQTWKGYEGNLREVLGCLKQFGLKIKLGSVHF